jgi:hypothetical protein
MTWILAGKGDVGVFGFIGTGLIVNHDAESRINNGPN